MRRTVLLLIVSALFSSAALAQAPAGVPVFAITPVQSQIKFEVDASVSIKGTFDKWNASLTFGSADISSGKLEVEIQAASVDTGSGMKNSKLKGSDFFDVKNNPLISFKSTKVVQTGPTTFEVDGNFTIRGVTKTREAQVDRFGRWHRFRHDRGDDGLRPQAVRNEQRHSVHQDSRPRRGEFQPQSEPSQRPSSEA